MNIHENARTACCKQMLIVRRLADGWSVSVVASTQGVTLRRLRDWRDRHALEGDAGLTGYSSRPRRSPMNLPAEAEDEIETLHRQRPSGPAIALHLQRPISTIGAVQRRRSLGRLAVLVRRPPVTRYER